MLATRRGAEAVTPDDFTAAIERIVAGLEKRNRLLNLKEREVVAHHELGHALVALSLPGGEVVQKISIMPRGIGSLGYTIQRPTEDRYLMTRDELENRMAMLLGGCAAEKLVFGELSTGAADDLAKANDIARNTVTRFGMDEKLGQVAFDEPLQTFLGVQPPMLDFNRAYCEQTAREIDLAVRALIERAFSKATAILQERRDALQTIARQLLEKEAVSGVELKALVESTGSAPSPRSVDAGQRKSA